MYKHDKNIIIVRFPFVFFWEFCQRQSFTLTKTIYFCTSFALNNNNTFSSFFYYFSLNLSYCTPCYITSPTLEKLVPYAVCAICAAHEKISLSLSFNYIYYPAHVTKNEIITTTRKKSIVLFSHLFNNLRLEWRVSVVSLPKIDKQRHTEKNLMCGENRSERTLIQNRFKTISSKECQ